MSKFRSAVLATLICCAMSGAFAQAVMQTSGALVIVPAVGEVRHLNDEAHATLMIEEQDKDKAAAASRVNQKMKQGIDLIKREDPQAILQTRGYYTYPVYADEQIPRPAGKARQPVGWRVGHYLELTTNNINGLPNTIASAQRILALNGLYFGLSENAAKKMEEQRIAAAYRNLTDRIAAIAKTMGRNLSDAVLDTVDFEVSGAYAPQQDMRAAKTMMSAAASAERVEEPSFEPGETTLSMRVVGKVRFK
ncbi:SIMPL domain-containing protein [Noviherbaspirillum autotrophicum]|nr:SIMPL domain-containing protein [Noviherbaspirillum autotrophicum]